MLVLSYRSVAWKQWWFCAGSCWVTIL